MTLKEVQQLVAVVDKKKSEGSIGTDSVVAPDITREDDPAELLWEVCRLANCRGIDLTDAFIEVANRKTGRD